jgi:2-oxoglutarate dehydrogenase E1 component
MSNYIGHTSFLNGANATFVAELYSKYLERPESVDPEWGDFFGSLHDDARALLEDLKGASWAPRGSQVMAAETAPAAMVTQRGLATPTTAPH